MSDYGRVSCALRGRSLIAWDEMGEDGKPYDYGEPWATALCSTTLLG